MKGIDSMPRMKLEITEISTYNEGRFLAESDGQLYAFRLQDMGEWDKLYDYLMRPMTVDAEQCGPAHYIVTRIY